MTNDIDKYADIINLPRPVSKRPRMSMIDRAAQFSPFAALTGHGDAVRETERLTDEYIELDENAIEILNAKLQMITEYPDTVVAITYFKVDGKKDGGAYLTASGLVKKIDEYKKQVIMRNGTVIPINDIRDISGDMFRFLDL